MNDNLWIGQRRCHATFNRCFIKRPLTLKADHSKKLSRNESIQDAQPATEKTGEKSTAAQGITNKSPFPTEFKGNVTASYDPNLYDAKGGFRFYHNEFTPNVESTVRVYADELELQKKGVIAEFLTLAQKNTVPIHPKFDPKLYALLSRKYNTFLVHTNDEDPINKLILGAVRKELPPLLLSRPRRTLPIPCRCKGQGRC